MTRRDRAHNKVKTQNWIDDNTGSLAQGKHESNYGKVELHRDIDRVFDIIGTCGECRFYDQDSGVCATRCVCGEHVSVDHYCGYFKPLKKGKK